MTNSVFRAIFGILAALLLLAVGAATLNWAFNRPPVPMARLTAIQQGTPREDVQAALGKPTSTYESNRKWSYAKPFGWSIVYVYFDKEGRFEKYEYDY